MKLANRKLVLDWIQSKGGTATYTEICRFYAPIFRGRGYDRETDRGLICRDIQNTTKRFGNWSCDYVGILRTPHKKDGRYLKKTGRGLYQLAQ